MPRIAKPVVRRCPWKKDRWQIDGLRDDQKRRFRKFFESKEAAKAWLSNHCEKTKVEGSAGLAFTGAQRADARRALDELAAFPNASLTDAAQHYRKHLEATQTSKLVSEAVADYKATQVKLELKARSLGDSRSRLDRFALQFRNRMVADLSVEEIEAWLFGLPLGPRSKINFHTVLNGFFDHCRGRKWCAVNPMAEIGRPKPVAGKVAFFTPDEIRRVLHEAAPSIVPALVIGAFAGLRAAEISRLDWHDVRLDRGHIDLSAAAAKTASRRLVQITANLVAWLAPFSLKSGPVRAVNERKLLSWALAATETDDLPAVKWLANGLRHSFGTYHLALHQDAARTAMQMGHSTTKMVFAHYNGVAAPETAREWFDIQPAASANLIPISATA